MDYGAAVQHGDHECVRTLELRHVTAGGEVPGGEGDEDGAAGPVDAAHAHLVLRQLPPHPLLRHGAAGRRLPPPLEELEEHGGGLVHVVVARAQEPTQRQVVHLLHAWRDAKKKWQLDYSNQFLNDSDF